SPLLVARPDARVWINRDESLLISQLGHSRCLCDDLAILRVTVKEKYYRHGCSPVVTGWHMHRVSALYSSNIHRQPASDTSVTWGLLIGLVGHVSRISRIRGARCRVATGIGRRIDWCNRRILLRSLAVPLNKLSGNVTDCRLDHIFHPSRVG